jgi:type I restriction enzyme S subunit
MIREFLFTDLVKDVSGGNQKIKKSDYSSSGNIPVIDQGKAKVGGFTDDSSYLFRAATLPVVIFGDHTCCVKHAAEPFAMGADGVKVLKPDSRCDSKYLFHYLKQVRLTDGGYDRHYKYLKRINIPLPFKNGKPDLDEQKRIAAILDKADAIRRKRRQALQLTDDFLRSLFLDMFGDPVTNSKGWPTCKIGDLMESVNYGSSRKAGPEGRYPIIRMGNITYEGGWDFRELKYIDLDEKEQNKHLVYKGEILFNRTNSKELVGKTAVFQEDKPMAFAGYLVRGITNDQANPEYISAYMNSKHGKATLRSMCKNIVGMANINAKEFQGISILKPPIALQDKFANVVSEVREKAERINQFNIVSNDLFAALQQQAFKGKL